MKKHRHKFKLIQQQQVHKKIKRSRHKSKPLSQLFIASLQEQITNSTNKTNNTNVADGVKYNHNNNL